MWRESENGVLRKAMWGLLNLQPLAEHLLRAIGIVLSSGDQ